MDKKLEPFPSLFSSAILVYSPQELCIYLNQGPRFASHTYLIFTHTSWLPALDPWGLIPQGERYLLLGR